jgi:hypothetical protein
MQCTRPPHLTTTTTPEAVASSLLNPVPMLRWATLAECGKPGVANWPPIKLQSKGCSVNAPCSVTRDISLHALDTFDCGVTGHIRSVPGRQLHCSISDQAWCNCRPCEFANPVSMARNASTRVLSQLFRSRALPPLVHPAHSSATLGAVPAATRSEVGVCCVFCLVSADLVIEVEANMNAMRLCSRRPA